MRHLSEMGLGEALGVILEYESLSRSFDIFIRDSSELDDRLDCFEEGAIAYEIGVNQPSWLSVKDEEGALRGIEESIYCFGGSEKLNNMLLACNALDRDSDQFTRRVCDLAYLYFEEEIQPILNDLADWSFAISSKDKDNPDLLEFAEYFIDLFGDEYVVDDKGVVFKRLYE